MRMISLRHAVCAALLAFSLMAHAAMPAHSGPPQRVVSMNLCTDQLAMLIAAPGQLHSVSYLASDEQVSVLADEAGAYVINRGRAEEIFLMRPDLVIAGTFTTRATVEMLRRLGFRVEEFAPASSFADIRANLRRMGGLLGRRDAARKLIAQLDAKLARYSRDPERRPLAAVYYANSYTSGGGTLANEALEKAGLGNLANQLGYSGTARLPLEVLVKEAPDIVIGGQRYAAARGRAYDNLVHPALEAVTQGRAPFSVPDKYWICGTPFTAEAVRLLANIAAEASE
jgi:iron complex transport system substrate-binding protein